MTTPTERDEDAECPVRDAFLACAEEHGRLIAKQLLKLIANVESPWDVPNDLVDTANAALLNPTAAQLSEAGADDDDDADDESFPGKFSLRGQADDDDTGTGTDDTEAEKPTIQESLDQLAAKTHTKRRRDAGKTPAQRMASNAARRKKADADFRTGKFR